MSIDYSVAYPWISGAVVLSLDLTRPYYEHLGVGIPDFDTLQGVVRKALSSGSERTEFEFPCNSEGMYLSNFPLNIIRMISLVDRQWGQGGQACLAHWILYVNERDNNPWDRYNRLFSDWAHRFRRLKEDSIGFSADVHTISSHFSSMVIAACDTGSLEDRYASAPLSPWDRAVCHSGGHREYTEFYSMPPFYDSLALAVRMHAFQTFWLWLVGLVGPVDMAAIARASRRLRVDPGGQFDAPSIEGAAELMEMLRAYGPLPTDRSGRFIEPEDLPLPPPPVARV